MAINYRWRCHVIYILTLPGALVPALAKSWTKAKNLLSWVLNNLLVTSLPLLLQLLGPETDMAAPPPISRSYQRERYYLLVCSLKISVILSALSPWFVFIEIKMFTKVSATAGCPPAHSLLPGKAAAEELKTMVHFMGHFHARSGRYLNISKKVL